MLFLGYISNLNALKKKIIYTPSYIIIYIITQNNI